MNSNSSTSELRDLYRELILDHARSPRNFGKLNNISHEAEGINPLCGDKLKLYFHVDQDGVIREAKFEGSGCAISVASASLLTDTVTGLSTARAMEYFAAITTLLAGPDQPTQRPQIELGKLQALQGVKEFPSRVKCATLAWHGLNCAINNENQPVTTE